MTHTVFGASVTQSLPAVKDSVSYTAGNGSSYCGEREFTITAATPSKYDNVLSLDKSTNVLTLGLPATALKDLGTYKIEIAVKLKDYPAVMKKTTFTVLVTDCVVTSFEKTFVRGQKYNINTFPI